MAASPKKTDAELAHEKRIAELAERQAEHDKKEPLLVECLDPARAAYHESQKPSREYTVKVNWRSRDKGKLVNKVAEHVVTSQNEADAWAHWCDAQGEYPTRRHAKVEIAGAA